MCCGGSRLRAMTSPLRPIIFSMNTPLVDMRSWLDSLYRKMNEFSPSLEREFSRSRSLLRRSTICPFGLLSLRNTIGRRAWLPAIASMQRLTQTTFCIPSRYARSMSQESRYGLPARPLFTATGAPGPRDAAFVLPERASFVSREFHAIFIQTPVGSRKPRRRHLRL